MKLIRILALGLFALAIGLGLAVMFLGPLGTFDKLLPDR